MTIRRDLQDKSRSLVDPLCVVFYPTKYLYKCIDPSIEKVHRIRDVHKLQGDPKQTQIFQTDRTWPKMTFWSQIENFYQFGFMNICYINWYSILRIFYRNTRYKKSYGSCVIFMDLSYLFVKFHIFFCGFHIFL